MDSRLYFHRKNSDPFIGVPVFSIMRNEHYFLPHFLAHYRRIGVKGFWIFADRCDEKFMAALESQLDVSIMLGKGLRFDDTFGLQSDGRPRRLGSFLKEMVFSEVMQNQWSLTVDADEFLIMPPQFTYIRDYTDYLDSCRQTHASAPLVDFYPERLRLRNFSAGMEPFVGSPYFGCGPYHIRDPHTKKIRIARSGFRGRLLERLALRFPEALASADVSRSSRAPLNFKVPLAKSSPSLSRVGNHLLNVMPTLADNCALAHFKLYPGIDNKIDNALRENQYFKDSLEYRLMKCAIDTMEDEDLRDQCSFLYSTPSDLVEAELLNSNEI